MFLKIEPPSFPIRALRILSFPPSEQDGLLSSRSDLEVDPPCIFALRSPSKGSEKLSQVVSISDEIHRRPIKIRCDLIYAK